MDERVRPIVAGTAHSPFVPQRLAMLASKERASDLQRLTPLIEAPSDAQC